MIEKNESSSNYIQIHDIQQISLNISERELKKILTFQYLWR